MANDSRQLILEAMILVVGRQGYKDTSVADVIVEANTSRTTFYKHFDDKHDCFIAAYAIVVERVLGALAADCDPQVEWVDRVRAGLERVVDLFAREPELARTAIVEVSGAGAEARAMHYEMLGRAGEYLIDGEKLASGRELPQNIALMAAGSVSGLIFEELLAGRARQLPGRLPELLFALLVPYLGPSEATAEMRRAEAA